MAVKTVPYSVQRDVIQTLGREPENQEELDAKVALLSALAARQRHQDRRMPFYQFLAMLGSALLIGTGLAVAIQGSIR